MHIGGGHRLFLRLLRAGFGGFFFRVRIRSAAGVLGACRRFAFYAAGLASVEAFDFEAFVLPLFSLTLPFLLVVDFNPGSYTVRVQFTPQKKDQVVSMPETLNQVRNVISASGDGMIRKQP